MSAIMNSHAAGKAGKGALFILALVAAFCLFALCACSGGSSASSAASSASESASSSAAEESSSASAAEESESSSAAEESESSSASEASEATEEGPTQEEIDAAIDEGKQVFPGTLRVMAGHELIALSDIDPNVFTDDGEYAVLIFDAPVQVSGMSADGSGMRRESATMLGVAERNQYNDEGDIESWRQYDGKHITVAVAAEDIMFPSDVRLPVGEPATSAASVL